MHPPLLSIIEQADALTTLLEGQYKLRSYRYTGSFAWRLLGCAEELEGMGGIDSARKIRTLFSESIFKTAPISDIDLQIDSSEFEACHLSPGAQEVTIAINDDSLHQLLGVENIDLYPSALNLDHEVVAQIGNLKLKVLAIPELVAHQLVFRMNYAGRNINEWRSNIATLCNDTINVFGRDTFEETLGRVARWYDDRYQLLKLKPELSTWECAWTVLWYLARMYEIEKLNDLIK